MPIRRRAREPPRRGRPPPLRRAPSIRLRPPPAAADAIPIRSAARGGGEQEMFLGDGPIGYTPRPANLAGVRDAYAIYMIGDSMEPRYEQGWLLHVNPFKPPTRGRDIVLYKTNDAVLIKQFVALGQRRAGPAPAQSADGTPHPARGGPRMPPRRRRRSGRLTRQEGK